MFGWLAGWLAGQKRLSQKWPHTRLGLVTLSYLFVFLGKIQSCIIKLVLIKKNINQLFNCLNEVLHSSRVPSLGIPRLELENPHWNSYIGISMSNVGIPTWVFSFLLRFLPNLMIFIIWMNLSSFIGTIYIEKSSNLAKIWAEMKKPTLEFQRWTLEFQRRNSNVQHRNSNVGFPTPT